MKQLPVMIRRRSSSSATKWTPRARLVTPEDRGVGQKALARSLSLSLSLCMQLLNTTLNAELQDGIPIRKVKKWAQKNGIDVWPTDR